MSRHFVRLIIKGGLSVMSKKYKHLQDNVVTYGIRDLSRGKLTEAVQKSLSQPVIIMKNNKPLSVIIDYNEYLKLVKEKNNEKK